MVNAPVMFSTLPVAPNNEEKYVYHICPKNMIGDTLYPLNTLKQHHPDLYAAASEKYKHREHVLATKVNADNALWNDHLFFSPIHPAEILKIWSELGIDSKRFEGMECYKIPISRLEGKTTLCFEYLSCDTPNDPVTMNNETAIVNIKEYTFPSGVRESTIEYWKNTLKKGQQPLLFSGVEHFLVLGNVNIRGCDTSPLLAAANKSEKPKIK